LQKRAERPPDPRLSLKKPQNWAPFGARRYAARVTARLLLLLAGLAIPVAGFEAVARWIDAYPVPGAALSPTRPDLYTADPDVGYRLHPSLRTTIGYPPSNPRPLSLNANSDGFRSERELGGPDSRPRILVVGDSFVFGSGVETTERFTEVLEWLEPQWRVDNLGMTGWGIDLMVRALEKFGAKARPDVVILAVYTDDFRRAGPTYAGLGFAIPRFRLIDGELVSVPYPRPGFWRRLRAVEAMQRMRPAPDRNEYALNAALLDRYYDLTTELGATPFVVFLPGRGDTPEDQQRRRFLARWASHREVPYLDLTGPIHGAGVPRLYIPGNFHWNADGHRTAAHHIYRELKALRPNLR
jgi:hypothetical protein